MISKLEISAARNGPRIFVLHRNRWRRFHDLCPAWDPILQRPVCRGIQGDPSAPQRHRKRPYRHVVLSESRKSHPRCRSEHGLLYFYHGLLNIISTLLFQLYRNRVSPGIMNIPPTPLRSELTDRSIPSDLADSSAPRNGYGKFSHIRCDEDRSALPRDFTAKRNRDKERRVSKPSRETPQCRKRFFRESYPSHQH